MSNDNGWVKLHRKLLKNPIVMKDSAHLSVWVYLLMSATHETEDVVFHGTRTTLHPGEVLTSRKRIATDLQISESKVERVLSDFKIEQQIEQRTDRQKRVISILAWNTYQRNEQRIEHRSDNDRTTTEQRVNTFKNNKNIRNKEIKNIFSSSNEEHTPTTADAFAEIVTEVIAYLNTKADKHFNVKADGNRKPIRARLEDGYTKEDCFAVIDNMTAKWKGDEKMDDYLRPSTLFGKQKFDNYRNATVKGQRTARGYGGTEYIVDNQEDIFGLF